MLPSSKLGIMSDFDAGKVLAEGRQHYTEKRHKKALECFTRVMRRCSCARGLKRDRCKCKNFQKVVDEGGSIFRESMYTCCCDIGKTFSKCDAPNHIKALDYRAATFEVMGELDRARADAEWLMELAPRTAEGYLRLGKIARLQKRNEFAWNVYNAGIEAVSSASKPALLEILYQAREPLHRRFCRRDPLSLPLEVLQIIFSEFDLPTLARCVRVSKAWRRHLTQGSNQRLWRVLHFPATKRAVTTKSLETLSRFSGRDVREIVIDNMQLGAFTLAKLTALILASPRLERLEVKNAGASQGEDLRSSLALRTARSWPNMRRLVWVVPTNVSPLRCVHDAVSFWKDRWMFKAFPNLEDLELSKMLLQVLGYQQPLPARTNEPSPDALTLLRRLRLRSDSHTRPIYLDEVQRMAPGLEQFWTSSELFLPVGPSWECNLKLKVLIADCSTANGQAATRENLNNHNECLSILIGAHLGKHLQHLSLDVKLTLQADSVWHDERGLCILERQLYADTPLNDFSDLRTFRLKGYPVHGDRAEPLFRSSLNSRKLRSFSICFPEIELGGPYRQSSIQHLRSYDWLKGAPSIRTLHITNFAFRILDDDEINTLPGFLATFENLETLEISSSHHEDPGFCSLLERIMRKSESLKTIWQSQVTGIWLDRLLAAGSKRGVGIKTSLMPQEWPVLTDS